MPGPSPKPDAERRRRNEPTFGWVNLPAEGRKGRTPALPSWGEWHAGTVAWWRELWHTPQATQWDQSGRTLWPMASLYDTLIRLTTSSAWADADDEDERPRLGRKNVAGIAAEIRQHEDRHGLNPKAMLQLRWRVVEATTAEVTPIAARPSRYSHLKPVAGDDAVARP